MSALEWLDAVRADLDAVSRFGRELDEAVTSREGRSVPAIADDLDDAHNALDGTAPDRLDRMERTLRDVLEAHDWTMHCGNVRHTRADAACDQCEAVCVACGERYPCPTVTTIRDALSDE